MVVQELDQDTSDAVDRPNNSITAQRISLWITPVTAAVFLIAFLSFPGFRPPMSPQMTADQVAAFFRDHTTMIRFSMITYDLFGVMLVPFFMLIVVQMKRMATPSPVFAYCYLSAVATGATLFAVADLFWLVAAFRPERDPGLVQLLNDMAWIVFTAPVGMLIAGNLCLALAIYLDGHPRPIFPRWVGHFNILVAVALAPAACAAVVQTGPLAWNGFVSFWLKIGAFSLFLVVMFFVLRTAINRQAIEEQGAGVSSVSAQVLSPTAPAELDRYRPRSKIDQWICWWSVVIFFNLFGLIFVVLTRVMPPPSPHLTTAQIVRFFHVHSLTIKIGFALLMIVVGFASWTNGLVAYHMKRMSVGSVWAYAYIAALAVGALPGCIFAAFCFLTAVFRPDRNPHTIALLYDMGLLMFIGSLGCFIVQYLVFALAILLDKNKIFPRWLAYVTIWQIVTEVLAAPVFIFKQGPFAWNGAISFWQGTAIFVVWQVCVLVMLYKAIQQQPLGEPVQDF